MKVKYLIEGGILDTGKIYNVFCYQEWKNGEAKIYLSDFDESGRYYLQLFNFDEFQIVDSSISRFWNFGVNEFGEKSIGVSEIFIEKNFWERYYDDDLEIKKILNLYYKVGKSDLFNTY